MIDPITIEMCLSSNEPMDDCPVRDSPEEQEWRQRRRQVFEASGLCIRVLRPVEYDRAGACGGGPPEFLPFVRDILVLVASSGITTGLYQLLKAWLEARNGRRFRWRVGDVELEATQLSQEQFIKLFALLKEVERREDIRSKLLAAGIEVTKKKVE